jgi:hypothetical protein
MSQVGIEIFWALYNARENWYYGIQTATTSSYSDPPCFQLKSITPDYTPVFVEMLTPPQLDLCELEPELILDRRVTKKGNSSITQILVKWNSLPEAMATWED